MLEKTVEQHLKQCVKNRGGECIKLIGTAGLPDRMVILPGRIVFVELKRPGERPRQLQYWWINRLKTLGFMACFCDSVEAVDRLMEEIS